MSRPCVCGGSNENCRHSYGVQVRADTSQAGIDDLIRATDSVTEIQNTLRAGCAVQLEQA